jgi:GNAT superfamily N-acetyltransferase
MPTSRLPEPHNLTRQGKNEVQIRTATVADADKIAVLLTQLGYPGTESFIREKIVQLNAHPDAELVVAIEDGKVLGFISIHFIPQIALAGSFARISYFCVEDEVRGRGIGRHLESYCEQLALDRDCDRIEVHCHSRRKRAHDFYYRQGYEESPKYLMKKLD